MESLLRSLLWLGAVIFLLWLGWDEPISYRFKSPEQVKAAEAIVHPTPAPTPTPAPVTPPPPWKSRGTKLDN